MMHSWQTSVRQSFLLRLLAIGTFCAAFGAFSLLLASIYLEKPLLNTWGMWIFLSCILLINLGLLPYKKLQKKEIKPDELILSTDENILYLKEGKPHFSFPLSKIKNFKFYHHWFSYGLCIELVESKQTYYLPYFSERSARELLQFLLRD